MRKPVRLFRPDKVRRIKRLDDGFHNDMEVHQVEVEVKGRRYQLVEKDMRRRMGRRTLPLIYYEHSRELRRIGVNVPTVRLMELASGEYRCFYTDLSKGGKLRVIEFKSMYGNITPEARLLSNFEAVKNEIEKQTTRARANGFSIGGRAWNIAVDPQIREGKPYVTDFKGVLKERKSV